MKVHFLNLTNGIEYAPIVSKPLLFIRLESTACEQKLWWKIIEELDYTFLMHLVSGDECIVYDTSAHKDVSRALYQGLEWVKFAVNRYCCNYDYTPIVKGNNCKEYFTKQKKDVIDRAYNKLRYVKKFVNCEKINLSFICRQSNLDGQYEQIRQILVLYQ